MDAGMRKLRALAVAGLVAAGLLTAAGQAAAMDGNPPSGRAVILSFAHSGKCVSVPGTTRADVQLTQWSCLAQDNQRWVWQLVAHDVDLNFWGTLRNLVTGKCMAVQNGWQSDGVAVIQTTCQPGSHAQQFQFELGPHISDYNFLVVRHSRKVVNVSGASMANGAKLIQYPKTRALNSYVFWY